MKYLKETYEITKENYRISPGHRTNISWTPIKNLQETEEISPGHRSNMSRTTIKYLKEIFEISYAKQS